MQRDEYWHVANSSNEVFGSYIAALSEQSKVHRHRDDFESKKLWL